MTGSMKLRSSIKPPMRFGEVESESMTATLLQSMRQARENSSGNSQGLVELATEKVVRQRPPKRKPQSVPFNPNHPPAVFPSFTEPQPRIPETATRANASRQSPNPVEGKDSHFELAIVENAVSLGEMENYAASNTPANPIYVENMKTMARCGQKSQDPLCDWTDSDLDEPIAKISGPAWSDIHPALQIEIMDNLLKEDGWKKACSKLGLNADDRKKLMADIDTRNKQVQREDQRLEGMRRKQLHSLMRMDDSDIKRNHGPRRFVLRRISRSTIRRIVSSQSTDLLMCAASDVLAARQYLHRQSLDGNLAGDWGQGLAVLRQPEDDGLDPERFESRDNLSPSPKFPELGSLPVRKEVDTNAKRDFILGIGRRNAVNPVDLTRRSDETSPVRDWGAQFPLMQEEWNLIPQASESSQENEMRKCSSGMGGMSGMLSLEVGAHRVAQIRAWGESGARMHIPQPSSPLTEPVDTPSKVHFGPKTKAETHAEVPLALKHKRPKPVTRSLGGVWSMDVLNPAASQARFTSKINAAKFEVDEQKLRAEMEERSVASMYTRQSALDHAPGPFRKASFAHGIYTRREELPCHNNMLSSIQMTKDGPDTDEEPDWDTWINFPDTSSSEPDDDENKVSHPK
ncbi:hypothetical protein N7492_006999 [Penicillium capsulatum]|uniref:Uncharacterized protein n=1 Tax=Penicillium capsulatum TaxID=69766 RepID=A0A9W9I1U7_9EURO|nr:hypothetical protein N7492_006999 [Penicillium capsulatum]KAJ6116832.1 hypothetical protein N7512_006557 [Penicillium capsulatum]